MAESNGPYKCKIVGCEEVFLSTRDLKDHLNQAHGYTSPITQLQLLNDWGYMDKEEKTKKVSIKMDVGALL